MLRTQTLKKARVTTRKSMDKKTVRTLAMAKRKSFKDIEQIETTEAYLKKLAKHVVFLNAKHIGIYYPIHEEMNLLSLIDVYADKTFYIPNIEGNTLVYRRINSTTDLIPAKFGLKEVSKDNESIDDCDLYIIPCVATSGLLRIGYGSGYFDRYLKDKNGFKLGLTYPCLKFDGINKEDHDVLLDDVL